MTRNSEGIKTMFGGHGRWNEPALPPDNSCALCQEQLQRIGKTALCLVCRAVYVMQENGLWNYLGKTNERHKKTG